MQEVREEIIDGGEGEALQEVREEINVGGEEEEEYTGEINSNRYERSD